MNRPFPFRPAALGVLLVCAACGGETASSAADPNLFRVVRRNLPIRIQENAELQALRETVVRSQLEGQATIIYLIEEGKIVEKDELLVRLDSSDLEDKRANQKISVSKAEAAMTQAQKNLEILEKELTTKRNTAYSQLRIAEMELEKFLGRASGGTGDEVEGRQRGRNADMVQKLVELVSEPVSVTSDAIPAGPASAALPDATPTAAGGPRDPARTEPATGTAAPLVPPEAPSLVAQIDPSRYAPLVQKIEDLLTPETTAEPSESPEQFRARRRADLADAMQRDMGDLANQVLQQVDQIRLAMADLKYQESYYGYSQRLAQKKFITKNELEKDKIEFDRRLSKVGLAWNDLDLLISYELFKNKIKLLQDVANARLELDRVDASNDAERLKASTDHLSKVEEYNLAKERLDNLEKQIKNAEIRAPTPGLVIYARLERDRRGGESIREGTSVRERQDLIILPDTTAMQAIVKVQEAVVAQVRVGQRALVVAEAYPDTVLTGRVTRVAQQADSNGGWMSSDRKVYTAVVELDTDNTDGSLKSRMAAAVTILVEEVHDVLTVPLQAVRRDRAVNFVWKKSEQGPQAVVVEVGKHNNEHVVIQSGLADDDVVYLTQPPGVIPPNLPQPEVPMPEVKVEPPTPAPGAQPAPGGANAMGNAPGDGPGNGGPGTGRGPGGRPGGGPGRGMANKPLAEMTPEELAGFKTGLNRYTRMAERARLNGNAEAADAIEAKLPELEKALAADDLATAQAVLDALRPAMRSLMGGMGNRGRRGGNDGNGDGNGNGAPGERVGGN